MALRFIQRIGQGERAPWGYGVAWLDSRRKAFVTMPVPFNVLAGMLRCAWIYLAYPWPVEVNPRAAYLDGYRDGRESMADDLARAGVVSRNDRNDRGTPCA